jgi:predicted HicB family RNase H-like nuclease
MTTNKARLNLYVQPEVAAKAKVLAALKGVSLSVLVEHCLEKEITEVEKDGAKLSL